MPTQLTEELIQTDTMPVRLYRSGAAARNAPVVMHLHGGAFVGGSLDAGRTVAALLADAGAVVISADYPLAPEHPFPYALDAAFRTLNWLHKSRASFGGRRSSVFVAGEEAGGNLAASLALMARDQQTPPLAGQILLSPMLDPCMATCSMREAEAGAAGCTWADGWHHYLRTPDKAAHPYASPLGSSRLGGLAPALVLTAQDDLLRDESLRYARRLRESGVTVDAHVLDGPTGWPGALGDRSNADASVVGSWPAAVRERFAAFFAQTKQRSCCFSLSPRKIWK
jgi:acetyl esterase